METEYYYRAVNINYAPLLNEFDEPMGQGRAEVVVYRYKVVRRTPRGVRLDTGKFILASARRQWASPSRDEAIKSFLARKEAEIGIYSARIASVERAIAVVGEARDCFWS